jgi:glycine reductase
MAAHKLKGGNSMLKGKQVIIIGERDGVPGPAIEACVRAAGAHVLFTMTQCFV